MHRSIEPRTARLCPASMFLGGSLVSHTRRRDAVRPADAWSPRDLRVPSPLQVLEPREFLDEGQLARAGRAVALLADDDLRDAAVLLRRLVLLLAVDEH